MIYIPIEKINVFVNSSNKTDYVLDHFEVTRPMPTFSFGFVISQMQKVSTNITAIQQPKIQVWARKDFHGDLKVGSEYLPKETIL